MTYVFMYRLASDTGLAPCVDNGLFTLACCKGGQLRKGRAVHTGLRYHIGIKRNGIDYSKDDVYVIGTYKGNFLYIARITSVLSMKEYYQTISNGRLDDIYCVRKNELFRNTKLILEKIHTDDAQIARDIAGEYVLISNDFIYLGNDAVSDDIVTQYGAAGREVKTYCGEDAEKIAEKCMSLGDNKSHKPHNPLKIKCGG